MSLIKRARLYPPPGQDRVLWSNTDRAFDGYVVFDLVLPYNWWYGEYPRRASFRHLPDVRAPHRVVVHITDGKYPSGPVLPLNSEYDMPETWYVANFHDRSRGFVSGPTVLFQVLGPDFYMNFQGLEIPNNLGWPYNPFTYTILFVDRTHGNDSNIPTGPYEIGNYLYPWRTVHNLEWFNPGPNNRVLIREDRHSPWVNITDQFPEFTGEVQ